MQMYFFIILVLVNNNWSKSEAQLNHYIYSYIYC